ncbi:MAG: hypothetical protein K940chlam8_00487 [Chlamydiae bacterium]|nr:hypothetical protein [Chlamydiota bacterium]
MTRYDDIKSLLADVKDRLLEIKNSYDQSLQNKVIPDFLRIDVTIVMGNLRPCLDYMAQDIYETIIAPHREKNNLKPRKRICFPYGKNEQDFNKSIQKNLPDLKTVRPDIYSLIEAIQPHVCGDTWLCDLCQIVNDNKHNSLSEQQRTSSKTYSVGLKGRGPTISALAGAITTSQGATISINGVPVTFDPNTWIPLQTSGLEVAVIEWVDFVFKDTNIKVYPLMMTVFHKIEEISKKFYEKMQ